jgi:RNA polymerase sigma-70 factor (ECF subfamily)
LNPQTAILFSENLIDSQTANIQSKKKVSDDDLLPLVPELSRVIAHYFKSTDDREDALQGLLTHLLIKLPGYKYKSPLSHWALKITSNFCISRIRRNKLRNFFSIDALVNNDIESELNIPVDEMEKNEHISLVQNAIEVLPNKDREIILMCDIMSKEDTNVASILGITHSNLRVKKHRARNALKKQLIKMGYDHE